MPLLNITAEQFGAYMGRYAFYIIIFIMGSYYGYKHFKKWKSQKK